MKHHSFSAITTNIWQNQSHNVSQTIKIYQNKLSYWNLKTFGKFFLDIKRTQARLYGIQKCIDYGNDPQLLLLEQSLQNHLKHLLEYEKN